MKKLFVFIAAIVRVLVTGCSSEMYTTRSATEIKQMFDNGETFVMFAGTKDCTSCKAYKPIVEEIIEKYDIPFYYMPADDYKSDEVRDVIYNYLYKLEWTPTTYIVVDGHSAAMVEETITFEELEDLLDKYGLITKK